MRGVKKKFETQCGGKNRHKSKGAAMTEAKHLGDVDAYKCPHCGGWHVGHTSGWIAKRAFFGLRR